MSIKISKKGFYWIAGGVLALGLGTYTYFQLKENR
jgi:hypothetical protein